MRTVIRSRPLHAAMARLALVAMLMLALLPTLGRLAPQGARAAQDGWAALCTATGLKYVDLSLHHATRGDDGATPGQPHGHGDPDCAYCPLLVSLLVAACVFLLLRECCIRGAIVVGHVAPARRSFHPCGLGSRGPPLAS